MKDEYQGNLTFFNGDVASKLFDREGEAIEWATATVNRHGKDKFIAASVFKMFAVENRVGEPEWRPIETCWDLFGDTIRDERPVIIIP